MPQVPVVAKTSLSRAQRRAVLRQQLRDPLPSVFTDVVLNDCLNEGLALVRQRYPWRRTVALPTTNKKRVYDLPVDFVMMVEVFALSGANGTGFDLASRAHGRVVVGYKVAAGAAMGLTDQLGTNTAASVIAFEHVIPESETYYLTFISALQDYGDATVISGGVDAVAQDLVPGALSDGQAPLLLYAGARTAAYRYALNYVKADGGDDWAAQYEYNLRERDRLLVEIGAPLVVARFTAGLF
jgi:hypothetical protein